ncbi:patatin-like phospholipase family protein [Psychrosphaera aestuarii]|uniref:patatin-like phospholipase family protein n=1 Tax=Psychrosphaera aestuarii TaxID=1266052 RepID=UPI0031409602
MGSSAGAFRASCLAQKDPVSAITELAYRYSETDFTLDASPQGVTRAAEQLLTQILPHDHMQQVLNNERFKVHFITALCSGAVAKESKLHQGAGLTKSLINNALGRQRLTQQYQRVVFSTSKQALKYQEASVFSTEYVDLTEQNFHQALLASGAIPMVMLGIKDIPGAPAGMYRDGGIIDYHFDFKIESEGLTLYPHFNSRPKAGWFDKNLKRTANPNNYDSTVMLVPSQEFVSGLPFSKIPDRTDFEKIDTSTRIRYWHNVFEQTERLAESFSNAVNKPETAIIKDLPF